MRQVLFVKLFYELKKFLTRLDITLDLIEMEKEY